MRDRKFKFQNLGLSVGIFGIVFGQSRLNFWDCFGTFRIEFLGLFSDSPG